ncbi:MAG TPA: tetratricopeptide repeat protein, partial [Bacteroidales bacterium]|nr:tetratricopeptide repeat protein [Bacteroidales bacterium]
MSLYKILPCLLTVMFFISVTLSGQDNTFVAEKGEAVSAYEKGDYKIALKHFRALLAEYPADPVYMYYTGACMIETGEDISEAGLLVKNATDKSSGLRPVPHKAWYYLGRYHQLRGNYQDAIEAYDYFRDNARRRVVKKLEIERLISKCENGEPSYAKATDDGAGGREQGAGRAVLKEEGELQDTVMTGDTISKPLVNVDSPGERYEQLANEALEYQYRSDSLLRLADRYRESLPAMAETDRQTVNTKILSLENLAFEYQRKADKKYREAAAMAMDNFDSQKMPSPEDKISEKKTVSEEHEGLPGQNEEGQEVDSLTVREEEVQADTSIVPDTEPEPVLVVFSDNFDQGGEIPVNPELPEGLIYRIQVAAFRNPKQPGFFKGLGPVSIYRPENSDINFYFIGMFRSKELAGDALVKVRKKGFEDAFILALAGGERISMEKAAELESEWSSQSLYDINSHAGHKIVEPAEPPTLVYRIQAMKTDKRN